MEGYKIVENVTENAVALQMKLFPLILLIFGITFLPIWLIYDINRIKFEFLNIFEWQIILAVIVLGTVMHELLHGIGWMLAGKVTWKKMKFGFNWKGLVPYAHCSEPMPLPKYLVGVFLPYVALGLFPWLLGLVLVDFFLLFTGIIFSIAAAGDLYIAWLLRKRKLTDLILDHPHLIGCQIVEKTPAESK